MKITRFNHAAVNTAGKLEESMRFYTEVLGLPTAQRPELLQQLPGAWLQLAGDNAQLHIIAAPRQATTEDPIDPLGPHVAYFVENLDQAEDELRAADYQLKILGKGTSRIIWMLDPAGNVVELQQDPECLV